MQILQKTKILQQSFFIILFLLLGTIMTNAQDAQKNPSIKFNLFSVDGLVISDTYKIDDKFAKRNNIPILAPFQIKAPRQKNVTVLYEYGTEPNAMIIKMNFATGDKDMANEKRKLIENLQFITMDVEMTDIEDRMKALTNLMVVDAFEMVTGSYEQKEYIGARRTKINNIDVIDAVGSYISPDLGLVYVRITGYLNPNDENGVFSVANIVADKFEITNLDQLFLTASGKTIDSFEYIE